VCRHCPADAASRLINHGPKRLQDFTINNSQARNIGRRIAIEANFLVAMYMEEANGFNDVEPLGKCETNMVQETGIQVNPIFTHDVIDEGQLSNVGHISSLPRFREGIVDVHLLLPFGEIDDATGTEATMAGTGNGAQPSHPFSRTTFLGIQNSTVSIAGWFLKGAIISQRECKCALRVPAVQSIGLGFPGRQLRHAE